MGGMLSPMKNNADRSPHRLGFAADSFHASVASGISAIASLQNLKVQVVEASNKMFPPTARTGECCTPRYGVPVIYNGAYHAMLGFLEAPTVSYQLRRVNEVRALLP